MKKSKRYVPMHDGAPFYTQNGLDCCYLDRCLMTGNKIIMENIYIKGKEDFFFLDKKRR